VRGRVAALAALPALALLPGCGNPGHDFRVHKLNPLIQRVQTQKAQLAATLRIVRPRRASDVAAVRAGIGQIAATMGQIGALKPPGLARSQFVAYRRANTGLVGGLYGFADALASGSSARMTSASEHAQTATGAVERAQEALLRKLGR